MQVFPCQAGPTGFGGSRLDGDVGTRDRAQKQAEARCVAGTDERKRTNGMMEAAAVRMAEREKPPGTDAVEISSLSSFS